MAKQNRFISRKEKSGVEWRREAIEQNFTRPRLVHGVCIQLITNNNNNNNSDLVSVKDHGGQDDDVQDR